MEIFVLGTSHAVASAALREEMHLRSSRVQRALAAMTGSTGKLQESFFLSTCARYEVYGVTDDPERAGKILRRLIARETGLSVAHLEAHTYLYRCDEAVNHALRVASGLESAVQGEAQILGQVRDRLAEPEARETMGPTLQRLFQAAMTTGKRVRSETEIGRGAASLAGAAIQLLQQGLGRLEGHSVLIIGAGETGVLIARLLRKVGVSRFIVANRSPEPAMDLARSLGGTAVGLGDVASALTEVDMVVGAAAAPRRLVDLQLLASIAQRGDSVPRIFLDLAHPRNFDPDVATHPGVEWMDLQTVHDRVKAARNARSEQVPLAEAIVDEERQEFSSWLRSRKAVPIMKAVRQQVLEMASREAERHSKGLDEGQKEALQTFARSLARTLLHHPTRALREVDPSTDDGRVLLDNAGTLFGVEPKIVGLDP